MLPREATSWGYAGSSGILLQAASSHDKPPFGFINAHHRRDENLAKHINVVPVCITDGLLDAIFLMLEHG